MNIPADGVNAQKARFFRDIAVAFDFLSLYNRLDKEQQTELMQYLTTLEARSILK
jgi:hypothetical protein